MGGAWQVLLAWVSQKALVVLNLVPARLLLVVIPINTVVLLLMVSIEFQKDSAGNPNLVRPSVCRCTMCCIDSTLFVVTMVDTAVVVVVVVAVTANSTLHNSQHLLEVKSV